MTTLKAHYGPFPVPVTPGRQGAKIVPGGSLTNARVGSSVAISADGKTVITGAPQINSNIGSAFLFTQTGSNWVQQGSNLTGTGNTGPSFQGSSVALSLNGKTALVGAFGDNISQGAAWVYTGNTKAAQSITFPALAAVTYGNSDISPNATSSNNTIPILYNSSNTAVATILNGKIHVVGAGSTIITASQAGNEAYSPATKNRTLTVNKAPLTITAANASGISSVYLPVFKITYSAFAGSDNENSLVTKPVATTSATLSSPVGTYPITPAGALSLNYAFTYLPATLTLVSPQVITAPVTKTYGDADFWLLGAATPPGLSYSSSNNLVATVNATGLVEITGVGITNITLSFNGKTAIKKLTVNNASLRITTINEPVVSRALSPNGDGDNDVLTISNIEHYSDNKFIIVNSNGAAVYEVKGYDNADRSFNGYSAITGSNQKAGTYFYRLVYKDGEVVRNKTGYFVIKK
ncbi:MAG: hypothetical protein EOP51_18975 [Sphingobacteriales bacterium]|nr:MAG: hypothetical protein EOP51_18975 [Sphingobacteriales bacterium]